MAKAILAAHDAAETPVNVGELIDRLWQVHGAYACIRARAVEIEENESVASFDLSNALECTNRTLFQTIDALFDECEKRGKTGGAA